MTNRWDLAFDVVGDPTLIQPTWSFDALFLVVAIVLATLGVAAWCFRWRRRWSFIPFVAVWVAGALTGIAYDVRHAYAARALVRSGSYSVVEGCLEGFHPGVSGGSRFSGPLEKWRVGGIQFDYAKGQAGFFYHKVEPDGGLVHATSRVRVTYIHNATYGTNEIVRLSVMPNACPPAPDSD